MLHLAMPQVSCHEASSMAHPRLVLLPLALLRLLLPLMLLPAEPSLTDQVSLTNKVQGVEAEVARVRRIGIRGIGL